MKYEKINSISINEFEKALKNVPLKELPLTLLSILNCDDYAYIQETYLKYINHQDTWVSKTAINGLSDLARIHKVDKEKVITSLNTLKNHDSQLIDIIDDCIDDINYYG